MKQSTFTEPAGAHAAIIMDGNGRWATGRGQPRLLGHRAGARVVRQIVEAAPDLGIGVLTLYAFSSDNWRRPPREVAGLMRLFRSYLASETARCVENGVRMTVIGRRDRLPRVLLRAIEAAEAETRGGTRLLLRIAIDYSARDAILAAAE
jgi:undecaprenyl diphosphate synthase